MLSHYSNVMIPIWVCFFIVFNSKATGARVSIMKQTIPFLLRLFIFDFSSQQRVQILNLPQYQSICNTSSISHLNSSPPSCVMSETLANIKACVHILYALTNATLSAKTADFPERTRFCAEPANTHVFTGIRTVVPLLKGSCGFLQWFVELLALCPCAELSTAFSAAQVRRNMRCTQTGKTQADASKRFCAQDSRFPGL